MTNNSSWQIPTQVTQEGERHFSTRHLSDAERLLKLSRVNISFSKGSTETYFICSGIIKEDRKHEAKVVYKKRLEGTDEGPVSSNCDCHKWNAEDHCPHTAALYLNYLIQNFYEHGTQSDETGSHPPIPLNTTFGVNVLTYGTILGGPHQLQGAGSSPTYSSLQYLLHSKKIINFPIPENWKGKLLIQVTSTEHFNATTGMVDILPLIHFKYRDDEGNDITEISLFENLYLFNWLSGEAIHIPADLKSLIQKIRIYGTSITVNDLIKMASNLNIEKDAEIVVDGIPLKEITPRNINCRINLNKGNKKSQVEFSMVFYDDDENIMPAPDFITAFTFNGGQLNSFRKKKDAYDFVGEFVHSLELQTDFYKKALISSNNKNKWQNLISYVLDNDYSTLYDGKTRSLCQFDNKLLKTIVKELYKNFGEMFFRFSNYDPETKEITYQVTASTLFQGLTDFYHQVATYGVSIFYDRNEISRWNSKIRFERKTTETKWFDLELNVSDADLEIIEKVDMDNGLALTSQGLVLLSKEQKDLLKFMKKYTQFESQGKIRQEGEEGENEEDNELKEEAINKFILPFNRSRIFELFELRKLGIEGALTEEEIALCERLATMEEMPKYDLPEGLDEILRPYQKTGYNWLRFLHENRLGACLADDMGLGKTLQSIAFIRSVYDKVDKVLIVCPVTLLLNWEKEFQKFSDLKVHIYHGGERTFDDDAKIILTSYGVMKREVEGTFAQKDFDVLILDEVQHLKNIRSQGAFAARRINAQFRICLTGTPVENDLAEFFNILDLSIPGIWGDLQFIRTTSNKKSRLLARKTASPFILRRTKGQVLHDLPPKIENNVYLNFTDGERHAYITHLAMVKKKIELAPSKKKYGEILRGLLELRQRCLWQNKGATAKYPESGIDSTKVDFLMETLEPIVEEGHQAIVFSQFTTYLDHIQKIIGEKHWKVTRIDGSQSVKKRQQQVDIFQAGDAKVFLISLKAGGVGLNLTAASYVFVMDPWWNPAVEQQAIDRAHRIGQKNTLTVYRPIIKDSVEEKVLELQKLKRELFADLLPEDEDDRLFSGKLNKTDFEDLFN